MKKRFHVLSRMFTKMNVFLFLLLALLMVPSAWANSGSLRGSTIESSSSGILEVRETDASSPRWFGDFYFNPGDLVTLIVRSGSLRALKIKDASGYDVEYNAFLNVDNKRCYAGAYAVCDSITFTMPSSNVTVTPVFGSDIYYNMPIQGTMSINVPIGTTSFKLYDDGGTSGNYTGGKTGYIDKSLNLVAPEGYCFRVTGSVDLMSIDYLSVREGIQTSYVVLKSYYSNDKVDIIVRSNIMSVSLFASSGNKSTSGFDLTVTLVKGPYSVSALPASNGSIGFDKAAAIEGEKVRVTASPNEGYFAQQVNVYETGHTGIDDNYLLAWDIEWYSNEGYFYMPDYDVSVRPNFLEISRLLSALDKSDTIWMKSNATKFVNIPSGVTHFSVVDHAGDCKNDNCKYRNSSQDTMVITVPEGYRMSVSGWVSAEIQYDYLCIYDGDNTKAPLMYGNCLSSTNSSGDTTKLSVKKGTSNKMTLYFRSDASNFFAGFNLKVNVEPNKWKIKQKGVVGGNVALESDSALAESKVSLTAKPNNGYMLADIQVKAGESDVKSQRISFNDVYFTMPSSDVTVTPTFTNNTNNWTAEGGLYLNMPQKGKTTVSIPDGVKSFKVYDDGGKDGNYTGNNRDTLVLKAPAGYVLQLSGSVTTQYNYDSLRVYNGAGVNADSLLGKYKSYSDGSTISISGKLLSKGNSMTLLFHSNGYDNYAGLDLTVKLVKLELEQGDDEGTHYVNMFFQRKMEYNIPETLKSFKVYDEGGKDGDYSGNNRDTLVLKAPAGYVLQLSGSVTTQGYLSGGGYYYPDSLRVYNGAGVNADSLLGKYKSYSDGSTISISGKLLSKGNSMTLLFHSNGYDNYAGLDLTVKLVKLELEQGDDEGTHYVNMFFQRKMEYNIPETLKSFKVYDEGGKDGDYSGNNRDTLVLKAPAGYVLQLSGSVTTQGYLSGGGYYYPDSLRVYNGAGVNADSLLGKYKSYSDGSTISISGKVQSMGNSMTLVFHSDGGGNYAGLDLTVKVVKLELEQGNDGDNYYVNMFYQRKMEFNIPKTLQSFKVYDEGGKDGDYSGNNRDTLVLKAPAGYVLQLSGSVTTQGYLSGGGYYYPDSLRVYNGAGVNADSLLGKYKSYSDGSTISISGKVQSMGNSMTLVFHSDGGGNYAGLDLTVTLVYVGYTLTVANVAGGRLAEGIPETANEGDEITLTAVPTNSNYMLVKFVVKDAVGNEVPVIRNTLTGGSFKMPASKVTITPVFANTRSTDIMAADSLHFDMTRNRKVEFNLPSAVKSFNLYDHGGKAGNYSDNSNDTLVFTAPAGYHFKMIGSIYTERNYDFLYVYDGSITTENELFNHSSAELGTRYDVGTIETSSNTMVVRFHSDGSRNYAGLDLTVTVVPSSYTVAIEQTSGGTLSSDKASAIMGEKVTLTATPDEGYMLNGFIIKDASGNDVPFRGGDFIDKKGSFTMPAGNATVTPVFTNKLSTKIKGDLTDIFLTIPVTGVKTVVLPEGLNAFKVYDDGGSTGLLTQGYNANGTLVLIAPENAKINATVVAGVASPATFKTYDGESTDATLLGSAQIGYREKYNSTGNAITFNMMTSETTSGTADININVLAKRNINVVSADGGTATSDKTTADRNETVTVTATPDDGLLFKGVKITDRYGDVLSVRNYETGVNAIWTNDNVSEFPKTVSFSMPNSDINIIPQFGEELEASDSLFLKTPVSGSETITIPSRVASFNVYDDGGRGGTFSSNADGNLVLTAPEGFRFQVSGSVSAWAKDIAHLCVYEGGTVSDDKALACGTGSVFTAGTGQDYDSYVGEIGTTVSEGNTITLRFWTTSSWTTGDGIELVVKVLKPHYGAVTIVKREDGTSKAILDGNYGGEGELEAINIPKDTVVDKVDMTRSFPTRTYSTVVLPFDAKVSKDKSKANVGGLMAALRYNGIKTVEGKSSIRMKVVWAADYVIRDDNQNWVFYKDTVLNANTPYLVMMDDATFKVNNTEPITIKATTPADTSIDGWTFRGTWQYKKWVAGDSELGFAYGFAASESKENNIGVGDFVKVGVGAWIRPMRAYLVRADKAPVQGVRANGNYVMRPSFAQEELPELMSIIIDDEDGDGKQTTVIGHFNTRTGEFKMNNDAIKRTFDVKGRNVGDKVNKARGAYYGKKVKK